jgi:hypothetical protein
MFRGNGCVTEEDRGQYAEELIIVIIKEFTLVIILLLLPERSKTVAFLRQQMHLINEIDVC